jgi:hypothetical protein
MIEDESENSLKSWAARFRQMTTRLDILTRSAPTTISQYSPTSIQVPKVSKPPHRVIPNLITAMAQLTEAKDAQQMFRIIQQFAPATPLLGKTMKMDLDRLPHVAFWAIERFVKKRFAELGKVYPQYTESTSKLLFSASSHCQSTGFHLLQGAARKGNRAARPFGREPLGHFHH